ncbi:MAG: aldo/keto reductase [Cyanobacteria bacterium P01_G01_bin.19]
MERRSLLKWLSAFTAGLILSSQVNSQVKTKNNSQSQDRLGKLLPLRTLGRTGEAVTMLGLGGWHLGSLSERDAQESIEIALQGGVRFFDTAEMYQSGGSETRMGKLLTPQYRDDIYLMTKTTARNAKNARRALEDSLRRLNTDYLDLWQVHTVASPGDVSDRIANGVFEVMAEAKASGKVRHIGFTGHRQPAAHLKVLAESDIFDTCQLPVNIADPSYSSFINQVMPALIEKNVGIIAMKSLANGGFFGGSHHGQHGSNPKIVPDRATIAEAVNFVWSMPVSVLVSGFDNPQQMQEKIDLANSFVAMDEAQRQDLIDRVADLAGTRVEFYKA